MFCCDCLVCIVCRVFGHKLDGYNSLHVCDHPQISITAVLLLYCTISVLILWCAVQYIGQLTL